MPEEGFIQMYVRDFTAMATRMEAGADVEEQVTRRVKELRAHAEIMDARKAPGHRLAVIDRLTHEGERIHVRQGRIGPEDNEQLERRRAFLMHVADMLADDADLHADAA